MFCYQCQETAGGKGCTVKGVCGKTEDVANLQDLLVYLMKGISKLTVRLREQGEEMPEVNKFITDGLFMTITNVNFDKQRFIRKIEESFLIREKVWNRLIEKGDKDIPNDCDCLTWKAETLEEMEEKAKQVGVLSMQDEDVRSLRQLLTYGIKGLAAYAEHAANLGFEDPEIYAFMQEALVATKNDNLSAGELTDLVLKCGGFGVKVMALLDVANTSTYGNPEITKVNIGVGNNHGILISGHDLRDLQDLLEQTEGTGVDVYTHGEMLPAHYYPVFKSTAILLETTAMRGGNRRMSLRRLTAPFFSQPTASCLPVPARVMRTRCTPPARQALQASHTLKTGKTGKPKIFQKSSNMPKNAKPRQKLKKAKS